MGVTFATVKDGRETWYNNTDCFACADWDYDNKRGHQPDFVIYPCENLARKSEAKFWVAAISQWLDSKKFDVYPSDDWSTVTFVLNVKGMGYRNKALLYLTFFRYLFEGSGFVAKFYEDQWRKKNDPDDLFLELMKRHSNPDGQPMYGHRLFVKDSYCKPREGLTLKDFKENLKKPLSVFGHFS